MINIPIIIQRKTKKPRMTKILEVSKVFAIPKSNEEINPEIFTRLDFVQYNGEEATERISAGDFKGFTLVGLPGQIKKILDITDRNEKVKVEVVYYQSPYISKKSGEPGIANRSSLKDLESWKIIE